MYQKFNISNDIIDEEKLKLRVIQYTARIKRVREPSIDDIKEFDATNTVKKSGLELIKSGEVSDFQVVENGDCLDVFCKVHAKLMMNILYPVSFSYSKDGVTSKQCECKAFTADQKLDI